MKKRVFGRKFNRTTNERKALFKGLMSSLVLEGKIKTTEAKAKAIRSEFEKAITHVKKNGEKAYYHLSKTFSKDVIDKIINTISPLYKDRPGGYLRIIKIGRRLNDNAPMVLIEWVKEEIKKQKADSKNETKAVLKEEESTKRKETVKKTRKKKTDDK